VKFGVVRFPGSCDERDALLACRRFGDAEIVWHRERDLHGVDAVVLPGGFSYGDYLRVGAIARFSPVMDAVVEFAREGGPVLGICNGFQVLCEARLLPGALLPNTSLRFLCRQVEVEVANPNTAFTRACARHERLSLPVKHGAGRYYAPDDVLDELEAKGQVALRYAAGHSPNGSLRDAAGVTNEGGNVLGLMPHPEHAVDPLTGSTDGGRLLASVAAWLGAREPVAA
jgi:phosphoribosylformylglycinamidine synthase subunit PurQ / glutaminase